MANINKIRLSGQTYNIQDVNATKTVELTQAQYDALTVKDPNTFYVITDAQGGDLSNYYTKSETSGKTELSTAFNDKQDTLVSGTNIKTINNESLLGSGNINIQGGGGSSYTAGDGIDITNDVISVTGKVDTTTYNTYTAATDTALASKQTTLTAGTGISIVDNVISATGGGGGGKAVSAGTNISITTGETADTINCTLPITISNSDDGSKQSIAIGSGSSAYISNFFDSIVIGKNSKGYFGSVVIGSNPTAYSIGNGNNVAIGNGAKFYNNSVIIGANAEGYNGYNANSVAIGASARAKNIAGAVAIGYNVYTNGTTKTNINNQLTIDTSNQVYISNSANTSTYCLQEKIENTEAALGGLSLVKLTQAQYDALENKDADTLYIIVDEPTPPSIVDEPTPPSFEVKWLATYTGGTTSSADCDSTSAITENEITKTDLESVVIGDCVTSIGNDAFYGCSVITSCTIGSGVTTIDGGVFYNTNSAMALTIYATTPPTLGGHIFNAPNAGIFVPSESVNAYKSADIWSAYAAGIQAIP